MVRLTNFLSLLGKGLMTADIKIEILVKGKGTKASTGKRVTVHYQGSLSSGEVFDASRTRGDPFSFELGAGQVIEGWEQGIKGMKIGEVRKLSVPPNLGYGETGAGDVIPPNASLVFEVELLEVTEPIRLGNKDSKSFLKAKKEGAVVIDIRQESEWKQTGIIAGAKTITAFDPNGRIHPNFQADFLSVVPSKNTQILLYCLVGKRSAGLGNALIEQLGYQRVCHLTTGIQGWEKDGYKTVKYQE
jgi:rhodanese-related sulfurtransferase